MGGGGGMGGGMFRVKAEGKNSFKVDTVCLEHGKDEPRPSMHYVLVPLSEFKQDPHIEAVCKLLANKQISQNVAQALAWHFADGLGWDEMAAKVRAEEPGLGRLMWFQPEELRMAVEAAGLIVAEVGDVEPVKSDAERALENSPGNKQSASDEAQAQNS
jgi:hypothetical protein